MERNNADWCSVTQWLQAVGSLCELRGSRLVFYSSLNYLWRLSVKGILFAVTSAALLIVAPGVYAASSSVSTAGGTPLVQGDGAPFPGVMKTIMERRKIAGTGGDLFSENSVYQGGGDWPEGGLHANLGIIAYHPFDGGVPLYQCIVKSPKPSNYFTSLDEGCEGQSRPNSRRIIGYVYLHQYGTTVPLYRCRQDFQGRSDHFDSALSNCEGWGNTINEGVLGYMLPY
jgi:hypothetical protein